MGSSGFLGRALVVFYFARDFFEASHALVLGHAGVKLHFDGLPYLADGPSSVFFEAAGFHT